MKIILVEDHRPWAGHLQEILDTNRGNKNDEIISIDNVEELPGTLESHADTRLVIVDLDLTPPSDNLRRGRSRLTGLSAFLAVEDFSSEHPPADRPKTAIMTADQQDDRLLLTLAAFQMLAMPPIDYLAKSQPLKSPFLQLVNIIDHGGRPDSERTHPFEPHRERQPIMDRLLGEPWCLLMWKAIYESRLASQARNKLQIKGQQDFYQKLALLYSAAAEVSQMMRHPIPGIDDSQSQETSFPILKDFAGRHALFFESDDVAAVCKRYADRKIAARRR